MKNKRLQEHFSIVKESSLFKNHYENVAINTIPSPIEKSTLRNILDENFNLQKEEKGVYLVRSGGSTDKPLIFPVDIKENLQQRKLLAEELLSYGMFSAKTVALNVFSYEGMYRSAAILDDILEKCNATTIAASSKASFEFMHTAVISFKVNFIIGTPSVLTLFANYVLDNNLKIQIENLLFAGEYLLKSQAEIITKAFHTKCIYSLYGSAETGIWGWSTYTENSTSFEVLDDVIIEIENPDEDGNGKVIVTNLLRKRFPVFRYFVGDIGRLEYKNNRQVLTLKSREAKSFSIEANSYFLDDFNVLLKSVERFQIQLHLLANLKTELKFLCIKNTSDKATTVLKTITKQLHHILDMNATYFDLKIEFVSETDLYINTTTSKTPIIIDFRN